MMADQHPDVDVHPLVVDLRVGDTFRTKLGHTGMVTAIHHGRWYVQWQDDPHSACIGLTHDGLGELIDATDDQ